jgi:hypothetical protein
MSRELLFEHTGLLQLPVLLLLGLSLRVALATHEHWDRPAAALSHGSRPPRHLKQPAP